MHACSLFAIAIAVAVAVRHPFPDRSIMRGRRDERWLCACERRSVLCTVLSPMRDPRYRFTDGVRARTRAIALRMLHSGEVAESPLHLAEWIARTEDLRESLVKAGYGSAFTSDDLFPLFQSYVAKSSRPAASRSENGSSRWLWIGVIVALVVAAIAFVIIAVG